MVEEEEEDTRNGEKYVIAPSSHECKLFSRMMLHAAYPHAVSIKRGKPKAEAEMGIFIE